jgi:hypothetical protein
MCMCFSCVKTCWEEWEQVLEKQRKGEIRTA